MSRVKRSVHAKKKRRATLAMAKGMRGDASRHYRTAKEAVLKADQYRYRDRKNRKRDFRRLWITRINAAARIGIFRRTGSVPNPGLDTSRADCGFPPLPLVLKRFCRSSSLTKTPLQVRTIRLRDRLV